uniref:Uncharacterized protein n=1 Tax=uncultured microorganism TaxID=358574 RepID=I2FJK6_9ZZZZ|nr:hypothetical protein [uncultured microorganism]
MRRRGVAGSSRGSSLGSGRRSLRRAGCAGPGRGRRHRRGRGPAPG